MLHIIRSHKYLENKYHQTPSYVKYEIEDYPAVPQNRVDFK